MSQRMAPRVRKEAKAPLVVLKEFIEAGKLTPVIDRTFPLSDVPEAIRYLAGGTLEERSSSRCKAPTTGQITGHAEGTPQRPFGVWLDQPT